WKFGNAPSNYLPLNIAQFLRHKNIRQPRKIDVVEILSKKTKESSTHYRSIQYRIKTWFLQEKSVKEVSEQDESSSTQYNKSVPNLEQPRNVNFEMEAKIGGRPTKTLENSGPDSCVVWPI
ncbi:hypothetical protein Bhyg_09463, partial [Pseudolycoriella hygida]